MTDPVASNCENHDQRQGVKPAAVIGIALMLCAFWMFVWRGSLDGTFHLDDFSNIVDNSRIRQLWPLDDYFRNNRPVGLYSFALNYHFSKLEPFAYLVTNLGIHLINGLLLFTGCWLSGRWWCQAKPLASESDTRNQYRTLLLASLISTLWVIHPITTQAVTYIVQRYESLASLGYLAAWVGLLVYLAQHRWLGCTIVLIGAWIGLLSKEVFATAPLVIVLYDRLLTRQTWVTIARFRWLPYSLMFTPYVWFIPSVARFFDPVKTSGGAMGIGIKKLNSWEYLRTQPEVIWHYLKLAVWPKDLCFDYDWKIQNDPYVYVPLGLPIVGVLLLSGYVYWRSLSTNEDQTTKERRRTVMAWLILVFFLILAPTSSVMPIADLAFEHRMYLASAVVMAGLVLVSSGFAEWLLGRSERPVVLQYAFGCIVLSVVALLAWRTHVRNLDYRHELSLWRSATEISPNNPRAWHGLGLAHYNLGDKEAALRPLLNAVGLSNRSVPLFDASLADCLQRLGRHADAITLYKRALAMKKNYPEVHNNLGTIYLELKRYDEAQLAFQSAIELDYPEAKYNLALLHLRLERVHEAVPLLEAVIDEQPELHVAARRLAWVLASEEDERIRDVARAERLMRQHYEPATSQNAYVLDTWAIVQAAKGDFKSAIESAGHALTLAKAASNESLIEDLTKRLEKYERREPWIETRTH